MAFVRVRVPRTSQPQDLCQLDNGNALSRSLALNIPGTSGRDAVGNRLVSRTPNLAYGTTALGRGFSSSANAAFSSPLNLSGTTEITISFILKRNTNTGAQVLVEHTANQNTNAGSFLIYTDGGTFYACTSSGAGGYNVSSCGAPADGRTTKIVVTLVRGFFTTRACRVWYDGVEQATAQPNNGSVPDTFANSTTYFLGRGASSLYANGVMQDVSIWGRSLSDSEIASLSANPWQIFEPEETLIWAPKVTDGGGSITGSFAAIESGSDTFTGSGVVIVTGAAGALAATEIGADTAAFAGAATAAGTLTATETGYDTFSATEGTVIRTVGALSAVEAGRDDFTSLAQALVGGALTATESGADAADVAGVAGADGVLATSEAGSDTAAISAYGVASGALAATEIGADTLSALATSPPVGGGSVYATESSQDTAAIMGAAVAAGTLSASEAGTDAFAANSNSFPAVQGAFYAAEVGGDSASAFVSALVAGALAAIEAGQDSASGAGALPSSVAEMAATESASDTAAANGMVLVQALLAAIESGLDSSAIAGQVYASGLLAATEIGGDMFAGRESVPPSDPSRTLFVGSEARSLYILPEDRTLYVQAEARRIVA